jgi:undecaprenyl-diphosphatase
MENIDRSLMLWLNAFTGENPLLDNIIKIAAGDYLLPVYASLILLWMWFSQNTVIERYKYQISVLIAIGSVGLTNFAVRAIMEIFPRARPFEDLTIEILFYAPTDPSFPSNPVSVLATIATAVVFTNTRIGMALFCMTILMAFARVYVGVAYPFDVIGGFVLGITCGLITSGFAKLTHPTLHLFLRVARVFCIA